MIPTIMAILLQFISNRYNHVMLYLNDIKSGILKVVIVDGIVQGITLFTDDTSEDAQVTIVELVATRPLVEADS